MVQLRTRPVATFLPRLADRQDFSSDDDEASGFSCGLARGLLGGVGRGLPDFFTPDRGDPGGGSGNGFGFFATTGKGLCRGVFWDLHGVVSSPVVWAFKSVRLVWCGTLVSSIPSRPLHPASYGASSAFPASGSCPTVSSRRSAFSDGEQAPECSAVVASCRETSMCRHRNCSAFPRCRFLHRRRDHDRRLACATLPAFPNRFASDRSSLPAQAWRARVMFPAHLAHSRNRLGFRCLLFRSRSQMARLLAAVDPESHVVPLYCVFAHTKVGFANHGFPSSWGGVGGGGTPW